MLATKSTIFALLKPISALNANLKSSTISKLQKLNIITIWNLLTHLPVRYEDRTRLIPLSNLEIGKRVLVQGKIIRCDVLQRGRKMLTCHIANDQDQLTLRFFHFFPWQKQQLQKLGNMIRCYGEIKDGYYGREMIHPEYQLISAQQANREIPNELTPFYSLTQGLAQQTLRNLIKKGLDYIADMDLTSVFPSSLQTSLSLPDIFTALKHLHQPQTNMTIEALESIDYPARKCLALLELVTHQFSLVQIRHRIRTEKAPELHHQAEKESSFIKTLPFTLTKAQEKVSKEIANDLMTDKPMLRLVQGDVGSGKTVVAALAMLQAVYNGYQAALMAPTELLAEQHYHQFCHWLNAMNIRVALLTGGLRAKAHRDINERLMIGQINVIIGTHALFQDKVAFNKLGLIVIDEQHRFGVHQRFALQEKGKRKDLKPHQLIMTATPIPRTLAMTAYADLDCSIINELPPGRLPIKTSVVPDFRRDEVIERIRINCKAGKQVYWVCPLIEDSEILQCQAVESTAARLNNELSELKIQIIHGRMSAIEKEAVMQAFKAHSIDILVATTVIEVGVDAPNASLMIIENAERLGLAQLHQLRGRVGRGTQASYCVLLYQNPLSELAAQRLKVMRETTDGFKIAEQDLMIRGPGELLGTRQTGLWQLRVADLQKDQQLLPIASSLARRLQKEYPDAVQDLMLLWLGEKKRYTNV